MRNKSKKYIQAIHWIANNDEPTIFDIRDLSTLISVCLIADLFKLYPEDVALDVLKERKSQEPEAIFDRIKQTYYACDACLQAAGGKPIPGHIFTVSEGTCEVCGAKDVTLIPWVDFSYPKDKKINTIAKANRD